jgi:hypothetical protein
MAWFNSDDLVAPRALGSSPVFRAHPDVDVVYGHRIIIDDADREIGRWIMPRHEPASIEWIDYVPQETLFWRKRAWDLAGGIDPSFQFALDWDLLARFQPGRLQGSSGCPTSSAASGCTPSRRRARPSTRPGPTRCPGSACASTARQGRCGDDRAPCAPDPLPGRPDRPAAWRRASAGRSLFFDVISEA